MMKTVGILRKKGIQTNLIMIHGIVLGYVVCKKKQVNQIARVVSLETKGKLKKVPVDKLNKMFALNHPLFKWL